MVAFKPVDIKGGAITASALSHYAIIRALVLDATEIDDFYGNAIKQKVPTDYALITELARDARIKRKLSVSEVSDV